MKIKLFLTSVAICMVSVAASADRWQCDLTRTAGIIGFKNRSIAETWVPKKMTVIHENGMVTFNYFDETAKDESPKILANGFEARDEFGLRNGNLSLLLKARLTFDTTTNTLKFRAPLNAVGYKNTALGGDYICK